MSATLAGHPVDGSASMSVSIVFLFFSSPLLFFPFHFFSIGDEEEGLRGINDRAVSSNAVIAYVFIIRVIIARLTANRSTSGNYAACI